MLLEILNARYISQLEGLSVDDEDSEVPKPLPWFVEKKTFLAVRCAL